jgi:23S rRNA pseudouridine2605 synthase
MESADRPDATGVRISKLLAQRGVASRRQAEKLVLEGEVTIDGQVVTELGTRVDPDQVRIRVSGEPLPGEPKKVYYLFYKPRGMVTGRDDEHGRQSVRALLDEMNLRVDPVGRLDYNTEGALLLTNDGDLAHQLNQPSLAVPKRYLAKVYRTPSDRDIAAIERGVIFPKGRSRPAKARVIEQTDTENAWVEITITESGPRIVQQILTQLGHPVSKLRRESFATLSIRGMERGQIRELLPAEVSRLKDLAGGVAPKRAGRGWRGPGYAKPSKPRNRRGA